MSSYSQAFIERRYQKWAKAYDWLTPFYLLGNEKRLRERTIASLHLQPGQSVLDIACGTGRNFALIREIIRPTGKLVGVDYTAAMLARARARVVNGGWENVELIQCDAAKVDPKQTFDAVLSTLAVVVISDYRSALDRMIARRPWVWLREQLRDFHYEEWSWEFSYVAGGKIWNVWILTGPLNMRMIRAGKDGCYASNAERNENKQ